MTSFKTKYSVEQRKAEALKIQGKFPDRIPIVIEKAGNCDLPEIDKKKYLVPKDLTVGQFIHVIRKRIKVKPEKAIFIFIDCPNSGYTLPTSTMTVGELAESHSDPSGFLLVVYSSENCFGFF